jgi:CxxC motif-containing protein
MSAPCINCFETITKLNVKKIIYSIENDFVCYKTSEYCTNHISQGNRYLTKLNKVK